MVLKLLGFVVGVALIAAVTGLPDDDQALDLNHGNQSFSKTQQTSRSGNEAESSIAAVTIQTPSYPNRYPKRSHLEWQFTVTGKVELFCSVFNLRPRTRGGRGTCQDYLQIESEEAGVKSIERYCADELEGVTTVFNTNQLDLTFRSSKRANRHFIGFDCVISPYFEPPIQECHCGVYTPPINRNNKIVGGKEARENQFPWQALMVFYDSFERWCGGSIINNKYILSAAHCIYMEEGSLKKYTAADFQVLLGELCLSETLPGQELLRLDVMDFIEHRHYNHFTKNNDIAVLKLGRTIDFANTQFSPICLPVTPTDPIPDEDDVWAVISGFGDLESGGASPDCLQYAIVPTMSNTECEEYYEPGEITKNMICAGYPGVGKIDSCQGDSGGPMATNATSPSGNYAVQIGVVSFGEGCADPDYPGVYARVTEYIDWIHSHTEGSSTCSPP